MDRMYYRTPSVRDQRFEGVLIDEIDRADGEQREAAGHPQLTLAEQSSNDPRGGACTATGRSARPKTALQRNPTSAETIASVSTRAIVKLRLRPSCRYDQRGAQNRHSGHAFFTGND
jgi:hypothetical protein